MSDISALYQLLQFYTTITRILVSANDLGQRLPESNFGKVRSETVNIVLLLKGGTVLTNNIRVTILCIRRMIVHRLRRGYVVAQACITVSYKVRLFYEARY
jgi:hypothetical protein